MNYTAVIRTLGKAGEKYRRLLESLMEQSIAPSEIIVYLAEGYDAPAESVGKERIVRVPKGMVAQRALPYTEVETGWMLCLDDDVELPADGVERLYRELEEHKGDVIAPSLFPNHLVPWQSKLRLTIFGKEVCRLWRSKWAYRALATGGFSYNNHPEEAVYRTELNGGPCFLCRKDDFLRIRLQDELWLDEAPYALPEDQVMFYKMHCNGLSLLTSFDSGIVHLDAGTTNNTADRIERLVYSEYRNKLIFWHRFFYLPASAPMKVWNSVCIAYAYGLQCLNSALKIAFGRKEGKAFFRGMKDGMKYIKSEEYKSLPRITKKA